MSPIFTLIILILFLGVLIFFIGLVTRKKHWLLLGSPAIFLILVWLVVASIPPNPQSKFNELFGSANKPLVEEIDTIKPTTMDGYFLSFTIPPEAFEKRLKIQFTEINFTNFHLLRGQDLPTGWPESIQKISKAYYKKIGTSEVLLHYDTYTHSAFASIVYGAW